MLLMFTKTVEMADEWLIFSIHLVIINMKPYNIH